MFTQHIDTQMQKQSLTEEEAMLLLKAKYEVSIAESQNKKQRQEYYDYIKQILNIYAKRLAELTNQSEKNIVSFLDRSGYCYNDFEDFTTYGSLEISIFFGEMNEQQVETCMSVFKEFFTEYNKPKDLLNAKNNLAENISVQIIQNSNLKKFKNKDEKQIRSEQFGLLEILNEGSTEMCFDENNKVKALVKLTLGQDVNDHLVIHELSHVITSFYNAGEGGYCGFVQVDENFKPLDRNKYRSITEALANWLALKVCAELRQMGVEIFNNSKQVSNLYDKATQVSFDFFDSYANEIFDMIKNGQLSEFINLLGQEKFDKLDEIMSTCIELSDVRDEMFAQEINERYGYNIYNTEDLSKIVLNEFGQNNSFQQ